MRERNLYLEKCRAVERLGEDLQWQGSSHVENLLLTRMNEVLYEQQDEDEEAEYGEDDVDR